MNATATSRLGAGQPAGDASLAGFELAASEIFVPLAVTVADPERFRGSIRATAVDGIRIAEVRADPLFVRRTPDLIARQAPEYLKLSLQVAGASLLVQDGRETRLLPGDLAVYDTSRPYSILSDDSFRTIVAMMPKSLVSLPHEQLSLLTAVRFAREDTLAQLVRGLVTAIAQTSGRVPGHAAPAVSHVLADLIMTLFAGALLARGEDPDPHRLRTARVKAYIDAHLGENELTPAVIAAANHMSLRHLHGLFHENGETVSSWIRARRLERCRRDLTDPMQAAATISAIARQWGFVDPAYFSQLYRERFGCTPSDSRASARP